MTSNNHPARATDPGTSHEAASYLVASGMQRDQQSTAAAAVQQHPGLTSMKLADVTGLDRYMLARRLPELLKTKQVWRGPAMPCPVSGRSACTWWPVAPGENLALVI